MPALLFFNAAASCRGVTRRRSTPAGIVTPCSRPSVLTQLHLVLCRCAAIARIVRRGTPGTATSQSSGGSRSISSVVTRLFVRHAESTLPCRSRDRGTPHLRYRYKVVIHSRGMDQQILRHRRPALLSVAAMAAV